MFVIDHEHSFIQQKYFLQYYKKCMDDIRLLLHTLPASRAPEFTPFFGGIRVAPLIRFCAVLLQKCMCLSVPSSVLWDPLQFPHKNDIRFVVTSSCLQKDSCLIYAFCVSLRIAVSNAYCVLLCFVCLHLVSCVPYVAIFSGLSIFDCPFSIL